MSGESRRVPEVAVIVPHYEQHGLLERCLAALGTQTLDAPYEIVMSDDGSRHSPRLPRTSKSGCPVRVVSVPHQGPAAARNAGAAATSAPILAFTDVDCTPHPTWLQEHVDFLSTHPHVAVTTGPVTDETRLRPWSPLHRFMHILAALDHEPQYFAYGAVRMLGLIGANLVVRASVFRDLGGFDGRYAQPGGEDYDFGLRCQAAGWQAGFVRAAVVAHRYPAGSRALIRRWVGYGAGKEEFAHKHGIDRAKLQLPEVAREGRLPPLRTIRHLARQHFDGAFHGRRFPAATAAAVETCFQYGALRQRRRRRQDTATQPAMEEI